MISPSQRPIPKHTIYTRDKYSGFEPAIPALKRPQNTRPQGTTWWRLDLRDSTYLSRKDKVCERLKCNKHYRASTSYLRGTQKEELEGNKHKAIVSEFNSWNLTHAVAEMPLQRYGDGTDEVLQQEDIFVWLWRKFLRRFTIWPCDVIWLADWEQKSPVAESLNSKVRHATT